LNAGLHARRKLTLVSAPAGFGKTTLVVAWLQQAGLPVAWLSLDEADNDLPRFLAYLAAALQQVDEGIGAPLLSSLQSPQLPAVDKVLTATLNEIALRADPLVLVLDDFHLLTDTAIAQVMDLLLDHQPPQLHLVLTTREDPELPLARLRARDQLTEIRAWELRFTQEETGVFLRCVMGLELSSQDVAVLEDRTEGWAAGLQLAGLSLQKQADLKAFIADFSGSHRHILDYLTGEVLQGQPQGIRAFLLRTAILDRLCAPLCDAVLGDQGGRVPFPPVPSNSQTVLEYLEKSNLFLIPLDEERRWYRYHQLFADLLRSQLNRFQPELVPELHRRASRWYAENGKIQAAVEHALQDNDLSQAAGLIEQHAFSRIYQGRVPMVMGWFDRLPEALLESAPMLCVSKAWALALTAHAARREEVIQALQAAEQALERVNAGEALRALVAGHVASIRAFLPAVHGQLDKNPDERIALSKEAMRLLPEEEKAIRSVNALNIGTRYMVLADLQAASLAFEQALEDGLAGGNYFAAIYGPTNLVESALLQGRLGAALQLCEVNIERFNRILAGQYFPAIGALYVLKASILLECDCLAESESYLTEGLELIRWTGEYSAHKIGYTALARLRAIQGDRPAMLSAVQAMDEAWPEVGLFARALRQSLSLRHWPGDPAVRKDAQTWLNRSGVEFAALEVVHSANALGNAYFDSYVNTAHVLARLAPLSPAGAYPLDDAHAFLERQGDFAASHGFVSRFVAVAIARTLLYQAAGKKSEALENLRAALSAAAPTGLFRIFVDEGEPLQALLEELSPRLAGDALLAYANRLLENMRSRPAQPAAGEGLPERLSERELEVLRFLAKGLTYEEIGRQLFLSLNTVQFHVKNIYGKLLVNKRVQAIEKARELHLI
jgi:LuxR family maltose regulon positive regulatory protein